ncbi:response regulator [Sporolactobacillus shoreicorticis]|uniref:Response regulator n=1 Tax=Sporolactobacillus shoreicorticis TaxID=1923877 RepID=A0ABW5S8E4_9BACL|nr:response regulator [Sporolactobacillus shoreicorticis]MCO7125478.1 response regulator [Sporolactobacillus shoreicorticis]
MNAFVVDDEELACNQLRKMLQETGTFQSIQSFTDPEQALDAAKKQTPDVAFLDIEMPELNGIELAEALQAADERIDIIFTTAYDEFAIKAFELNAIDYLLKPIMKPRLTKAVERLLKNRENVQTAPRPPQTTFGIECFDSLKFYKVENGMKTYIPVKWRTSRARELYAYLLKEHDRFVSKESLIDLLWTGVDDVKGTTQLYTTVYQIRKLMEKLPFNHHIIKNDIGYSLTLSGTAIDVERWEEQLTTLPPLDLSTYKAHIQYFKSYRNHYFSEYGYLWAESERIRLAELWFEHAYRLAKFLIKENKKAEALDICQQINQIEPDDERTMKLIIKLYNEMGNVDGAIRMYERYKESKDAMN